jgi:RNA polymerase sigma-70 factor, ECF subfamily
MNHPDFFHNELKDFVMKRVKDGDLANDIVQDVFIKVQTKYDQLTDDLKITSWIYLIAQNTIN